MHSAFAGEVRFVVENNGKKRIDTGFNKNLILDQGLHFFGGGHGADMMQYCLVGAGNSTPTITQNQLDSCITGITGAVNSTSYNYVVDGTNTYKCSLTKSYVFTDLAGQNISEVGLASEYSSPISNYLCTRALIKDTNDNPTVLSLISGDTLTIYYKLWVVHSTLDTNQIINMSDGFGGSEQFNVKYRLHAAGSYAEYASTLSQKFNLKTGNIHLYSGEIVGLTEVNLTGSLGGSPSILLGAYNNDYSIVATITASTGISNGGIRLLLVRGGGSNNGFGLHQIRFGRVSDDAAIAKDNTKELTIPIKFTWGRYEGEI